VIENASSTFLGDNHGKNADKIVPAIENNPLLQHFILCGVRCFVAPLRTSFENLHRLIDGVYCSGIIFFRMVLEMNFKTVTDTITLSKEEETALVHAARAGNRGAINRLVRSFNHVLVGYMLRNVWWMQPDDAEDLAQETWKEVLTKIGIPENQGGYSCEKGRFFTWIKNYILDFKIKRHAAQRMRYPTAQPSCHEEGEDWISRLPDPDRTFIPDVNLEIRDELQLEIERLKRIHLAYIELLRILFRCGGYPHQQLAYAFSKLVFGRESDRGTEGSPQRLNREYGTIPLEQLIDLFWKSYCATSNIPEDILNGSDRLLEPTKCRLEYNIATLFLLDRASRDRFAHIGAQKTGATTLCDFWEKHKNGFTSAVPDWCYKVRMRIQRSMKVPRDASETDMLKKLVLDAECENGEDVPECSHCRLRHLPPCGDESGNTG